MSLTDKLSNLKGEEFTEPQLLDVLRQKVICETEEIVHKLENGYRPNTDNVLAEIQLINMICSNIDPEWEQYVLQYFLGNVFLKMGDIKDYSPEEDQETVAIFIGAVKSDWNTENDFTYENIMSLTKNDSKNCKLGIYTTSTKTLKASFDFVDINRRLIVVGVPKTFPPIKSLVTSVQTFLADSFDSYDVTLSLNGKDTAYKVYVFKNPLLRYNSDLKINF